MRAQTWFIPGKSPIKASTLHRGVAIDTRTGRVACPPLDPQHVRIEVYEFWPSDLAHLFAQAGMPRRQPPASPCADDANDGASGTPPAITSPLRATTYTQRAAAAPQVLALAAAADARELHWFANEAYLGAANPGVSLGWKPNPGAYILRVVDDHGRSDARDVRVELVQQAGDRRGSPRSFMGVAARRAACRCQTWAAGADTGYPNEKRALARPFIIRFPAITSA